MNQRKLPMVSWSLVGLIVLVALFEFAFWLLQQTGPSSFTDWVTALGHVIYGLVLGGLFARKEI